MTIPLAYFDTRIPVPAGWEGVPSAYLSFGGGQAAEVSTATDQGRPVTEQAGHHLHLLTAPEEMADAIIRLAHRLLSA